MIEARNLHKVYRVEGKELHVLKGIDLSLEEGSLTALVGPSGAGKSTLLHILGGLDEPSRGNVSFFGEDMYSLTDKALAGIRNEKIGFVFQSYHLLAEFTVLENVCMPAVLGGGKRERVLPKAERLIKAGGLLKEVGLEGRADHFPSQLSGGEQQRTAIARALMNSPRVLLCDEPTGNLDSAAGDAVIKLIRSMQKKTGMTVILVTHNKDLAAIAGRTVYLKDGVIAG